MTRFIDELRAKAKTKTGGAQTAFKRRVLDFCLAIDWLPTAQEREEARERATDVEQTFFVLLGAVDYYQITIKLIRNEAFEHTQIALTQPKSGKSKIPTTVNIRADNAEDCIALARAFLEAYGDTEWKTLK